MDIDLLKSKSDLSVDEINILMEQETDVKIYKKLFYFRFRAMGYSVKEASSLVDFPQSTAYYLENVWEKDGYNGLLPKTNKPGSGRKTKLNKRQLKNLKKYIERNSDLTIHDVQKYIKENFNVDYTYMGIKKLLTNQFDVDITDFLGYTPKSDLDEQYVTDDFDYFLVYDQELYDIISLLNVEKDVFTYRKLLSFVLIKLSMPLNLIGDIIGVTKDTIITWTGQWVEGGLESLKKKTGQGRKPKLTDKNWEELRKILSKRQDWLLFEIQQVIKNEYNVFYDQSHLSKLLKTKLGMHFAKPYPKDYRQSPYFKQIFHLRLYHIFKNLSLRYDPETGNITNMDTNEPFHILSFDEATFQFTSNDVKFWALIKPLLETDTTIFQCKTMGSYALSDQTNDYLEFVDNKKSETVIKYLENLRKENPIGDMLLLIDNFGSHGTDEVLKKAEELNIYLCFLPTYSPQLQPIEKIWKDNKKDVNKSRVTKMEDYSTLSKTKRKEKLEEIVKDSFYENVKNKNKWNKVLNNYIKPKIKSTSPEFNEDWEVQKV